MCLHGIELFFQSKDTALMEPRLERPLTAEAMETKSPKEIAESLAGFYEVLNIGNILSQLGERGYGRIA